MFGPWFPGRAKVQRQGEAEAFASVFEEGVGAVGVGGEVFMDVYDT